jgi:transposase-like protein
MAAGDRKNPKRAKSSESRYSLVEFMRDFPDDDACLEWLWATRYCAEGGDGAYCPKCQCVRTFAKYATKQRRQSWTCTACGQHVHPTAGTIFHKSSTSLHLWFYAMYLMTSTRCGISAKQLERELGVTYKTAWRMFHLIRKELMTQDDAPLVGAVEADDTFVGGKPRQSDKAKWRKNGASVQSDAIRWSAASKTQVFGAVERGGRVRATVVEKETKGESARMLAAYVDPDSTHYTDEYVGFNKPGEGYAEHKQIIEGLWSLVKRGISGTHHSVSAKHLQGYLNEYARRYSNRDDDGPALFALLILRAALTSV